MNRLRSGYSLVEMLATIAVTAAVLTVVSGWLVSLMRGEKFSRERVASANVQDRLVRQFREDVHAARSLMAEGDKPGELLQLTLSDEVTVDYRLVGDRIYRRQRQGDRLIRRESYRLPPPGRARIELAPGDEPTLASLLIEQQAARSPTAVSHVLRIDAQRGLHRRLTREDAK